MTRVFNSESLGGGPVTAAVRRQKMDADEKRLILAEYLNRFRAWTYEALASEIDRTRSEHDCLATFDGVADDGTEFHLSFDVFWDDRRGGDIRVCGDITTPPKVPFRRILPIHMPDASDSFIMAPDGSFVGE